MKAISQPGESVTKHTTFYRYEFKVEEIGGSIEATAHIIKQGVVHICVGDKAVTKETDLHVLPTLNIKFTVDERISIKCMFRAQLLPPYAAKENTRTATSVIRHPKRRKRLLV